MLGRYWSFWWFSGAGGYIGGDGGGGGTKSGIHCVVEVTLATPNVMTRCIPHVCRIWEGRREWRWMGREERWKGGRAWRETKG